MLLDGIPMTIQECYNIVINDKDCGLDKYRAYKKLVLQGYRLVRHAEILRKESHRSINITSDHTEIKKRKLDIDDGNSSESVGNSSASITFCSDDHNMRTVFDKLRQNIPSQFVPVCNEDFVYAFGIFSPHNKSRTNYDFLLVVW